LKICNSVHLPKKYEHWLTDAQVISEDEVGPFWDREYGYGCLHVL